MIGILTFHHVYNYGALFQVYALQNYLKQNNFESVIIDVQPFSRELPPLYKGWQVKKLLNKNQYTYKFNLQAKGKKFDNFRKEYLNITDKYQAIEEALANNPMIDILIVGSDQVWHPKFGDEAINTYLLKNINNNIKKISYAACIGTSSIDSTKLDRYPELLKQFNHISTRDEFSKEYVKKFSDRDCDVVVDPTLLINWNELEFNIIEDMSLPDKYIFVYGMTERIDEALNYIKRKLKLPIIAIGMENEYALKHADICIFDAGPVEWLNLIKNASFVVTKSFHGFMLSLQFRKQVLVISHGMPASARLEDAVKRFKLEQCLINDPKELSQYSDFEFINYPETMGYINQFITQSKQYLISAIS